MKRRGFIFGAMAAVVGAVVGIKRLQHPSRVAASLSIGSRRNEAKPSAYGKAYHWAKPAQVEAEIDAMNGKHGVDIADRACWFDEIAEHWCVTITTYAPHENARTFTSELTARLKAKGALA